MSHDLLPMGEFFNSVAQQYDEVQTSNIDRGEEYYEALAAPFETTQHKVSLLSLGAGSGLDLVSPFQKIPFMQVDCVDMSDELMKILKNRFPGKSGAIDFRIENYLEMNYPEKRYDYVLASATLHHLRDKEKKSLFRNLATCLKDTGKLVIGDFYVSSEIAVLFKNHYDSFIAKGLNVHHGKYHLDIPTTIGNEMELLVAAGFEKPELHWQSSNYSVISAILAEATRDRESKDDKV
jgi:tRNA (cmo5U34)-methyltransferase